MGSRGFEVGRQGLEEKGWGNSKVDAEEDNIHHRESGVESMMKCMQRQVMELMAEAWLTGASWPLYNKQ